MKILKSNISFEDHVKFDRALFSGTKGVSSINAPPINGSIINTYSLMFIELKIWFCFLIEFEDFVQISDLIS